MTCELLFLAGNYGSTPLSLSPASNDFGTIYISSNGVSMNNLPLKIGSVDSSSFHLIFDGFQSCCGNSHAIHTQGNVLITQSYLYEGSNLNLTSFANLTINNSRIDSNSRPCLAVSTLDTHSHSIHLDGSVLSSRQAAILATGTTLIPITIRESSFSGPTLVSSPIISHLYLCDTILVGIQNALVSPLCNFTRLTILHSTIQGTSPSGAQLCSSQERPIDFVHIDDLTSSYFSLGRIIVHGLSLTDSTFGESQAEIEILSGPARIVNNSFRRLSLGALPSLTLISGPKIYSPTVPPPENAPQPQIPAPYSDNLPDPTFQPPIIAPEISPLYEPQASPTGSPNPDQAPPPEPFLAPENSSPIPAPVLSSPPTANSTDEPLEGSDIPASVIGVTPVAMISPSLSPSSTPTVAPSVSNGDSVPSQGSNAPSPVPVHAPIQSHVVVPTSPPVASVPAPVQSSIAPPTPLLSNAPIQNSNSGGSVVPNPVANTIPTPTSSPTQSTTSPTGPQLSTTSPISVTSPLASTSVSRRNEAIDTNNQQTPEPAPMPAPVQQPTSPSPITPAPTDAPVESSTIPISVPEFEPHVQPISAIPTSTERIQAPEAESPLPGGSPYVFISGNSFTIAPSSSKRKAGKSVNVISNITTPPQLELIGYPLPDLAFSGFDGQLVHFGNQTVPRLGITCLNFAGSLTVTELITSANNSRAFLGTADSTSSLTLHSVRTRSTFFLINAGSFTYKVTSPTEGIISTTVNQTSFWRISRDIHVEWNSTLLSSSPDFGKDYPITSNVISAYPGSVVLGADWNIGVWKMSDNITLCFRVYPHMSPPIRSTPLVQISSASSHLSITWMRFASSILIFLFCFL